MDVEVTAVMPAYNAARYIDRAIKSALTQTVPCRILIINDASSDETLSIAESYVKKYPGQICVINNEKKLCGHAGSNKVYRIFGCRRLVEC